MILWASIGQVFILCFLPWSAVVCLCEQALGRCQKRVVIHQVLVRFTSDHLCGQFLYHHWIMEHWGLMKLSTRVNSVWQFAFIKENDYSSNKTRWYFFDRWKIVTSTGLPICYPSRGDLHSLPAVLAGFFYCNRHGFSQLIKCRIFDIAAALLCILWTQMSGY